MLLGRAAVTLLALVSFALIACSNSFSPEPTTSPEAVTEAAIVPEMPTEEATVTPVETRGPAPTVSAPLAATVEPATTEIAVPPTFTPVPTATVQPTATQPAAQCPVSGPPVGLGLENLEAHLPKMYLLASVSVGSYNGSYAGYDAWQRDYYGMSSEEGTTLNRHVLRQAIVAIGDPNSTIGFTLRAIEQACDSLESGLGTRVWWDYLLAPLHSRISIGMLARQSAEGYFIQAFSDYRAARISSPRLVSFGDFLAAAGYLDTLEARLNPEQSQSPSPTPVAESVPNEGAILYDRPLSEWRSEQRPNGWTEATSTSLIIGVHAADQEEVVETWTDRQDFGDISASVDVREVSNGAAAVGCLSVRHTASVGDYSFCILGNGQTWAGHYFIDTNGSFQVETLLEVASRPGTTSAWNTLSIVADGNQLTFMVNDTVHGTVTHDARTTGGVALAVVNQDAGQDAEFEFRNLVVREAR